ncbi:AIG2-like protein [Purpureocillium lavendulum]|uniref:Putative gamma-glutamylcyclotransferase n=1 Tax=Purpureocillium lavendulum TaxID=1247861 RepID=A0AB34FI85_9HYPO|nr:AIG2-like protein [Purpureocillium lavendulum]
MSGHRVDAEQMAPEIFYSVCYGSKNPPEVIRKLHTFTPAVLHDHCRHRVKFADYPAVVPEKDRSVQGVYATGLTEANLDKLDYFEGSEYERVTAQVEVLQPSDGGEVVPTRKDASVYIFLRHEQLEEREWDFEEFRREKMALWTRGDWAFDQAGDDKAAVKTAA